VAGQASSMIDGHGCKLARLPGLSMRAVKGRWAGGKGQPGGGRGNTEASPGTLGPACPTMHALCHSGCACTGPVLTELTMIVVLAHLGDQLGPGLVWQAPVAEPQRLTQVQRVVAVVPAEQGSTNVVPFAVP